jgi:hypothetical protein
MRSCRPHAFDYLAFEFWVSSHPFYRKAQVSKSRPGSPTYSPRKVGSTEIETALQLCKCPMQSLEKELTHLLYGPARLWICVEVCRRRAGDRGHHARESRAVRIIAIGFLRSIMYDSLFQLLFSCAAYSTHPTRRPGSFEAGPDERNVGTAVKKSGLPKNPIAQRKRRTSKPAPRTVHLRFLRTRRWSMRLS